MSNSVYSITTPRLQIRCWDPQVVYSNRIRKAVVRAIVRGFDALYPGWSCSLHVIGDPLSEDFCQSYRHRHLSQFFNDPLPRARAYLAGFPPPT